MSKLLPRLILAALLGASVLGPASASPPQGPEDEAVSLEEFVPTEKVRADHAVAFPVDI